MLLCFYLYYCIVTYSLWVQLGCCTWGNTIEGATRCSKILKKINCSKSWTVWIEMKHFVSYVSGGAGARLMYVSNTSTTIGKKGGMEWYSFKRKLFWNVPLPKGNDAIKQNISRIFFQQNQAFMLGSTSHVYIVFIF